MTKRNRKTPAPPARADLDLTMVPFEVAEAILRTIVRCGEPMTVRLPPGFYNVVALPPGIELKTRSKGADIADQM